MTIKDFYIQGTANDRIRDWKLRGTGLGSNRTGIHCNYATNITIENITGKNLAFVVKADQNNAIFKVNNIKSSATYDSP